MISHNAAAGISAVETSCPPQNSLPDALTAQAKELADAALAKAKELGAAAIDRLKQ